MRIAEIIAAIEAIAPLSGAAAWDMSGLQVAATRQEARRLAVCLDPTPAAITAALRAGAEMVLSHHPLSLKPALPNRLDAYHAALRLLFQADAPLYAAHTSLDANTRGPAAWLAEELGLRNLTVLEATAPAPDGGLPMGFGMAGDLPEPLTVAQVAAVVARHAPLDFADICGPVPDRVRRLAYCGGSGASLLPEAAAAGAELLVTGDVKYHAALDAAIAILDVGHHSLEEEMMRRMSLALQQRLSGAEVVFIPSATPFRRLAFA